MDLLRVIDLSLDDDNIDDYDDEEEEMLKMALAMSLAQDDD